MGDTTKALNDYNTAISLNRFDPEGFIRRSRIFTLLKQDQEALEDLNSAVKLDSSNTYAYFNRALFEIQLKGYQWSII